MSTESTNPLREICPYTDRVRVRFRHHMTVGAAAEKVFPLLCPVREFDWIPDWDCRIVYTESGVAERGCVFQTETAYTETPGGGLDTWVVSHHEPPKRISFVRVDPKRTILYDIFLESDGEETRLEWCQEITALDEDGDRVVGEMNESDFAAMIRKIEAMLERFLARAS